MSFPHHDHTGTAVFGFVPILQPHGNVENIYVQRSALLNFVLAPQCAVSLMSSFVPRCVGMSPCVHFSVHFHFSNWDARF
jgi:hypothetical protein